MKIIFIIQFAVLFIEVKSFPSISGVDTEAASVQKVAANGYDSSLKQGNSLVENESNSNIDHEKNLSNAQDTENFVGKNHIEKQDTEHKKEEGQKFHQQEFSGLDNFGQKVSHKKGHHKTGFHNSYYKDEGGSNSSFFDDGEDEGGELIKRVNNANYGDLSNHQYAGANFGNNYNLVDHNKGTYKNDQKNYEKAHGDNLNRVSTKYHDAHENAEDQRRFHENGAANHRVSRPEIRRTITIYEDPRVAYRRPNRDYDYPDYDGNRHISLQIRDPREYYRYPDYPAYDYY